MALEPKSNTKESIINTRNSLVLLFFILLGGGLWGYFRTRNPHDSTIKRVYTADNKGIIAIGDLAGNKDNTLQLLKNIGIIDNNENWIAKDTILVQMGDILDRGNQEKALLDLLLKLQTQAKAHNSELLILAGNHEVMNFQHDFRYAPKMSPDTDTPHNFSAAFKTREEAFQRGKTIAKKLVEADISIFKIVGDTLFVHAGIHTDDYPLKNRDQIEAMNQQLRDWLSDATYDTPTFLKPAGNTPIWFRPFNKAWCENEKRKQETIEMLKAIGCKRMVVGHTPMAEISSIWDGTVYGVDTGIGDAEGARLEALEICNGKERTITSA